jgi:ribosomal-protein-alanine acetyltransferase
VESAVNHPPAQVLVRSLTAADIDAVLAVQARSLEASQWSRDGYARAAAGEFGAWAAAVENGVVGFLVLRTAADEAEILNLAVQPESRRQGVAGALLAAALQAARQAGAIRAFLEVRESNAGAIAFYQCHGFRLDGRRRRYYHSPQEDALVLSQDLK